MIIDNIENAEKYSSVHPQFEKVFAALRAMTGETPDGRTEIDGDSAFINLSSYSNKPRSECKFESHLKYIDIQYIVAGHEIIDVSDAGGLTATDDRLKESDIAFYENPDVFHTASLTKGCFIVLFPGEAHRPLVAPDDMPVSVKKAVAKILL